MHHQVRPGHSGTGPCAGERRGAAAALLTVDDYCWLRIHIEHCRQDDCLLVAGLLRRKIAQSDVVRGRVASDLATGGSRIRFMITGSGARSGGLMLNAHADQRRAQKRADADPVFGFRCGGLVQQRALLLRDDDRIDTVALLAVSPAA